MHASLCRKPAPKSRAFAKARSQTVAAIIRSSCRESAIYGGAVRPLKSVLRTSKVLMT
jgi:hypothetical protein